MNLEDLTSKRTMDMNNKEGAETGEKLLEKATLLHEAFEKSGEKEPEVEAEELEKKFQKMLRNIPDEAIRNRVAKMIDILKRENTSKESMQEIVEDAINLNMEHYFDLREYVKLARKELSKYRLKQMIDELADQDSLQVDDLKKLARVAFDLNGLKAMNDLGGHDKGDEGLRLFSTILREGKTTKWLEGLGFVVIPSSEGGDEFGAVISGLNNNRALSDEMIGEISKRYHEEVLATDAKNLVNLSDAGVNERLLKTGFRKKQIEELKSRDFAFRLSSSVGLSRFDEALDDVQFEPADDYKKMVNTIVGRMFKIADDRAIRNKEAFKGGLEKSTDPNERALFEMYSRLDKESIKLRIQNRDLRDILNGMGLSEAEIDAKLNSIAEARKQEEAA